MKFFDKEPEARVYVYKNAFDEVTLEIFGYDNEDEPRSYKLELGIDEANQFHKVLSRVLCKCDKHDEDKDD